MTEPASNDAGTPTTAIVSTMTSSSPPAIRDVPVIARIGERIVNATDAREAVFYTQLRGEIIQQDAADRKKVELLKAQRRNFWFRIYSSAAFLATGTGLIIGGFTLPGFFIVGGSLALVVPDYVKHFVNTAFGKDDSDE